MKNQPDIANNDKELRKQRRLTKRLMITNILLILTIAFLIMVLLDLTRYFENPPSGTDFYDLFKGHSCAGGTIVSRNTLPSNVQFSSPASGSSSTIVFLQSPVYLITPPQ